MAVAAAAVGTWVVANAGTIAAVTAVGSAVSQGMQARQQAKAQEQYQRQQNQQALKSMQNQYGQLSSKEADAHERALQDSMQVQEQYAQKRARVNLMSAASGTAGLSVDSMIQDLRMGKGKNMNTILRNQEIEMQGFRDQAEAIRTGTASRIDNRKIQRPSWAEIGISAAGQGLAGYSQGMSIKREMGYTGDPAATFNGKRYGDLRSQVNYPASQAVGGV